MESYDVIIIGGGPAGLTVALTLASAEGKFSFVEGKRYLVIYDQYSDLDKALLNNVPGIDRGTYGRDLLKKIRNQVSEYRSVDLVQDKVVKAEGKKGDFKVYTERGKGFRADILVLATGFHRFDIEGLDLNVVPHIRSPRPRKIMIEHKDNLVREGLYVAGLVAGEPTMFVSAAGSGAKVACDILSLWAGKTVVVHDVPEEE
ncbi:FAD-dependent oxidoreductase [Persephonella sp.]